MNKLIIDELDLQLDNFEGELNIIKENVLIHFSGNNKLTKLDFPSNGIVTFELLDHTTLQVIDVWKNEAFKKNITILSNHCTKLFWNISILANKCCQLNFETIQKGDYNEHSIKFHVVTENAGSCKIKSTGCIKKNTKENIFSEELKGLVLNENSLEFIPELIVDSNVTANHNATIKCIDEQELFYLESKGISKDKSKELIKNGFLESLLEEVKL